VTAEWLSAGAAAGSFVVTFGALLFARQQIVAARENAAAQIADTDARERRQRVDRYLARLNHIEFLPLVAAASDLLNTEPLERSDALRAWLAGESVDRLRTLAFLNFFEEVAGQYNAGMLDAGAANRELVPTAVHYWEVGGWFIGRLKAEQPRAFDDWETMVNALRLAELG
jgi:hypothetical protein